MEHFYAVIMAGGGGTRLWPMSRVKTPKQLLPLVEAESMFRVSVSRLEPLFAPEQIYVVAGTNYAEALHQDVPEIPAENFIAEPYGRNSGPAAALAVAVIRKRDPQAVIVLLTADHHIKDKTGFRELLMVGYRLAQQGKIATLGITPSYGSTAFGYIECGSPIGKIAGHEVLESKGFTEKPNQERAEQFFQSGQYYWNSGMFIWSVDCALREFERQQPALYQFIQDLTPSIDTPQFNARLADMWESIKPESLDYAVMENANDMVVIPANIGWSDVGSWDSLFSVLAADQNGNAIKGEADNQLLINTRNTLVYSEKLTVTIGLENIIIVDTDDVLMVCHKDNAQDVRQVVDQLRRAQRENYL